MKLLLILLLLYSFVCTQWIHVSFVHLKPLIAQVISGNVKSGGKVRVCGLLYGMRYQSEMRVRYRNSSWSEWSQPTEATTLITGTYSFMSVTALFIMSTENSTVFESAVWRILA